MAMSDRDSPTVAAVRAIAEPIAAGLGLSLWDIRFQKEGASWYLRIFIDKEGGVSINDCEAMSHAIDKPLDDADPIDKSYCLEVCSPGLERDLTRPAHFEAFLGAKVMLRFIRPFEGARDYKGILESYDGGHITVRLEDGRGLFFELKETSFVHLDDFNE